ncbi:hypothetical protein [Cellulosimicrobium sp. Marseille-Q8652]
MTSRPGRTRTGRRVVGDTEAARRQAWKVTFAGLGFMVVTLLMPGDWVHAQVTGTVDACRRCYELGDPFPWWTILMALFWWWFGILGMARAWGRYRALRAADRRTAEVNRARVALARATSSSRPSHERASGDVTFSSSRRGRSARRRPRP